MARLRRWKPRLRPRAGRRLPRALTARRLGLRIARRGEGLRDRRFAILLRRIDQAPIYPGNRVDLFFAGDAVFAAMHQAIGAAREEVLLESYILRDDRVGRGLLESMAAAVRRGVVVRVLADAFGSFETHGRFWREMRRRGISVRLFHPLLPALWYQPFRDHRKLLVVDRRVAFTGGMNIGEEYGSAPGHRPGGWRDTQVRVEGAAAWEMAVVFSEGWIRSGGEPFRIADLEPPTEGDGARVLVLDARPGRGHREVAAVLAALVAATRERLWITNSYFAPGHVAVEILTAAAARGVDVRLLLPGTSDVPLVRHAGHGFFGELLAGGVRIFEYQPAILHAKSLVADGYAAVVGSTNLDFRSFHLNAECNLLLLDEAVASVLTSAFEVDLAASREIERPAWRRRPWPHRLGDRAARSLAPLL